MEGSSERGRSSKPPEETGEGTAGEQEGQKGGGPRVAGTDVISA